MRPRALVVVAPRVMAVSTSVIVPLAVVCAATGGSAWPASEAATAAFAGVALALGGPVCDRSLASSSWTGWPRSEAVQPGLRLLPTTVPPRSSRRATRPKRLTRQRFAMRLCGPPCAFTATRLPVPPRPVPQMVNSHDRNETGASQPAGGPAVLHRVPVGYPTHRGRAAPISVAPRCRRTRSKQNLRGCRSDARDMESCTLIGAGSRSEPEQASSPLWLVLGYASSPYRQRRCRDLEWLRFGAASDRHSDQDCVRHRSPGPGREGALQRAGFTRASRSMAGLSIAGPPATIAGATASSRDRPPAQSEHLHRPPGRCRGTASGDRPGRGARAPGRTRG